MALEACEFWQTFCEVPQAREIMPPYLPRIIPVLLQAMVYSEEDVAILDTAEVDDTVPDRQEVHIHHPLGAHIFLRISVPVCITLASRHTSSNSSSRMAIVMRTVMKMKMTMTPMRMTRMPPYGRCGSARRLVWTVLPEHSNNTFYPSYFLLFRSAWRTPHGWYIFVCFC